MEIFAQVAQVAREQTKGDALLSPGNPGCASTFCFSLCCQSCTQLYVYKSSCGIHVCITG